MIKWILILAINLIAFSSKSQQLEFEPATVNKLFNQPPHEIFNFLSYRGWKYTHEEEGFNFFEKNGQAVQVYYKKNGMSLFSYKVSIFFWNHFISSLEASNYKQHLMKKLGNGAWMGSFFHSDGLHICSIIRSPYDPDIMSITFGNRK